MCYKTYKTLIGRKREYKKTIIDCILIGTIYLSRKNAVIHCWIGRWVVRRAGVLPIRVCKSRRPEGTRLVLPYEARLTACINFCYKIRHRETTIGSGGGFDLRLLSETAHIFGSSRDTRGGWRVRVFFGLLSFVLHVVPRSAPRGVSGPHITLKGTDFGLICYGCYVTGIFFFSSDSTISLSLIPSRARPSSIKEFYFFTRRLGTGSS